jgi:hypothetical protein
VHFSVFREGICCKPGIFVCSNDPNIVVGARLAGSFGAALAGGQLFYQTLTGTGTAFIEGGGTILVKVTRKPAQNLFGHHFRVAPYTWTFPSLQPLNLCYFSQLKNPSFHRRWNPLRNMLLLQTFSVRCLVI